MEQWFNQENARLKGCWRSADNKPVHPKMTAWAQNRQATRAHDAGREGATGQESHANTALMTKRCVTGHVKRPENSPEWSSLQIRSVCLFAGCIGATARATRTPKS